MTYATPYFNNADHSTNGATTAASSMFATDSAGLPSWTAYTGLPISASNILINPLMEIDQANEGAAVASSGTYVVDGWVVGKGGSATISAQQVADAPSGMTNSAKLTVSTGAAVGSTDFLSLRQPIEATLLTDTLFGTANAVSLTLTFWVKCSISSYVMSGCLRNAAADRSYPFNFTVSSSATWEKKTITITGDTGGTWVLSGTAQGMDLILAAAVGSSFQGTVNTWAAANKFGTSSNTNTVLSTNGATIQFTGVKLEIAGAATGLVRMPPQYEMLRAQRYYRKSYVAGNAPGAVAGGAINNAIQGLASGTYSCTLFDRWGPPMRAQPTLTMYSPTTGASGKVADNTSGSDSAVFTITTRNTTGIAVTATATAAGTSVNLSMHITADARL